MTERCARGKILRSNHCKSQPNKGGTQCKKLQLKAECKGNDKCSWMSELCVKDQGQPGKTPKERRWAPNDLGGRREITNAIPGKKMPFNNRLGAQRRKCNLAGQKMLQNGISYPSAISAFTSIYNLNQRSKAPFSAGWDSQRKSCLNGVRVAYDRQDKLQVLPQRGRHSASPTP